MNPRLVKLAKAGKVVLLPHMGSATIEGRNDMGDKVIVNIKTWNDNANIFADLNRNIMEFWMSAFTPIQKE